MNWIGIFIQLLIIGVILSILLGIPTYFLWNYVMPSLFGLKTITLGQAIGLVALSRCLFGNASVFEN